MPRVVFTENIQRHFQVTPREIEAQNLLEALERVFSENENLRGYILDDQGTVRKHINIFIDGQLIADRTSLSDMVAPESEIYVMQALSGG